MGRRKYETKEMPALVKMAKAMCEEHNIPFGQNNNQYVVPAANARVSINSKSAEKLNEFHRKVQEYVFGVKKGEV